MVTMLKYRYEDDYVNESTSELTHTLCFAEELYYQSPLEKNSFFVEGLDDDFLVHVVSDELIRGKDEQLDKHSPKLLPTELLENYQIMQQASEKNPLKILNTLEEQLAYVKKMENICNRSTQQHIKYMQSKGFEGNVDERTWYRIARQLRYSGVLKDLEV